MKTFSRRLCRIRHMPRREEHGQGDDNLPCLIDHGQSTITCIVPSEKVELLFSATTTDSAVRQRASERASRRLGGEGELLVRYPRTKHATFLEGRISSEAIFWMKDALPLLEDASDRTTDRPRLHRGPYVVACEYDRASKPILSSPSQFCGG